MKAICFIATILLSAFFANHASAQSADTVKTAVLKVTNLHCDGDMPTIKKRLLNQDGVDEVAFTERSGTASVFTIRFHSVATTEAAIEKAIETTPGCDEQTETPYRVQRSKPKKKKP